MSTFLIGPFNTENYNTFQKENTQIKLSSLYPTIALMFILSKHFKTEDDIQAHLIWDHYMLKMTDLPSKVNIHALQ